MIDGVNVADAAADAERTAMEQQRQKLKWSTTPERNPQIN